MSPFYPVKEEYPEPTCSFSWESPANLLAPRPMEGLNVAAPPPFLTKTYEMVEDESTKEIVYWSRGGHSFVVGDPNAFSSYLLPRFFKHNNFSSFVRQLNTYGFRKIDPERWEFANEGFVKGQRHLLKSIKRRKTPSLPVWFARHHHGVGSVADPHVEVGRFGLDGEVNQLRRDKQVLMTEIVKLRQQEQSTRAYLQAMEHRLQAIEIKQQQMMSFLARAMQNPAFLQQLVQQKEKRKELEMALNRKRRRPIEHGRQGGGWVAVGPSGVKAEPLEFKEHSSYGYKGRHGMSELEELALEMQGYGRGREAMEEDEEIDDEFWEDLMKERFKQMVQKEGEEKEES